MVLSVAPLLSTSDEDLLKAAAKCLAHFTHGCDAETATQVQSHDFFNCLEDLLCRLFEIELDYCHLLFNCIVSQVRGEDGSGLERLVALMKHEKRSVWEAVMATVVNLSHLDRFRDLIQ